METSNRRIITKNLASQKMPKSRIAYAFKYAKYNLNKHLYVHMYTCV